MADLPTSIPGAHSAAVYRYAVELVEDTRRANDTRLVEARDLAAIVRIADEPAADRILSAAEEACARDLHIAEQQAEEVVRHARAGILSAVQRYTDNLVAEARRSSEARLGKATELAELVRLADSNAADRLLQAIQTVNEAALRTAERQAQGVLETAQTRLSIGVRPQEGGGTAQIPAPAFGAPSGGQHTEGSPGQPGADPGSNPFMPAPGQSLGNGGAPPAEHHTEESEHGVRPQDN